jgi:hypothetical protein
MPTSFKDILEAFEFVGMSGSLGENLAFLCRRTGKIYWHSEFSEVAELNDELPDGVSDEEKYIAIPDKLELGLGKPLERDDFSSNRHPALCFCLSMIFSENRFPLFRIML